MLTSRRLAPPRDREGRFVNWAGTVVTRPSAWHEPRSSDEIVELVQAAARAGHKLRVVGAGHSWSAIAAPEQLAVSLDRHAGIVAVHEGRRVVTVRGGTRLRDLNARLAELGLALPIVGSVAQQSVAGAIGTGTHGSSLAHGNLASLVEELELVTGTGERLALAAGDERLDGARVHLGALGVITQVTLRVEPAFRVAESIEAVPLARVIGSLAAIARSAEYVKVWWFPHTHSANVHRYQRTLDAASLRPSPATLRWIDENVLHARMFPWLVAVQRRRPDWVPACNRAIARSYARPVRVGRSDLMLSTPMPFQHRETEAALPLASSDEAFDRLVRLVERERLRVNMPLELRFVRGDAGWLSPASGADTCQIGAYAGSVPDVDRYFSGFWRELRPLAARPHWGKELDHHHDELRPLYPHWQRFAALRDRLDPGRILSTPFQVRILGD